MIKIMMPVKTLPKALPACLFLALVFLLPSNLGYHFIAPFSYVHGILVDYLIPTLYLTDILIILIFITFFSPRIFRIFRIFALFTQGRTPEVRLERKTRFFRKVIKMRIKTVITARFLTVLLAVLFVLGNTVMAENQPAATYKWLKLAEIAWLGWWLAKHPKLLKKPAVLTAVKLSLVWQSVLTILQWLKQSHIFPYWVLGEQPLSADLPLVKTIGWFGRLRVVPMGTFPHPNVLAAFLVLGLLLILKYDLNKGLSLSKIWPIILGTIALWFTFSLPAWTIWLTGLLMFIFERVKLERLTKVALLGLVAVVSCWGLMLFGNPNSINWRLKLNRIAWQTWQSSPIAGVGLNNFTVVMSKFGEVGGNIRFLQPVHNVFLLVLAETGIMGLLGLIFFGVKKVRLLISKVPKKKHFPILYILSFKFYIIASILFLSLFDHYFFTTQQGLLMTVVFIGLWETT